MQTYLLFTFIINWPDLFLIAIKLVLELGIKLIRREDKDLDKPDMAKEKTF